MPPNTPTKATCRCGNLLSRKRELAGVTECAACEPLPRDGRQAIALLRQIDTEDVSVQKKVGYDLCREISRFLGVVDGKA